MRREVLPPDVPVRRLIESVIAHDAGLPFQAPHNLDNGIHVVPLQVLLNWFALDEKVRGEVVAPEEQRKHRRRREPTCIGRPDDMRERISVRLMDDGGACVRKPRHVEADRLQRPARGPVAPREPAPDVLVRIHEHGEAHVPCQLDDLLDIVEVLGIVEPGPSVLDRLPRHQEPQQRQSPRLKARQVQGRL